MLRLAADTLKVFPVAEFKPVAEALRVYPLPDLSRYKPEKPALPELAFRVVVPLSVAVPGLDASDKVMLVLPPNCRLLELTTSTIAETSFFQTVVLDGCVRKTNPVAVAVFPLNSLLRISSSSSPSLLPPVYWAESKEQQTKARKRQRDFIGLRCWVRNAGRGNHLCGCGCLPQYWLAIGLRCAFGRQGLPNCHRGGRNR